jgi:hypothetical protein
MRTAKARRREAGVAAVELALMTTFIVPMILYTIYIGEAFITSLRAQEAEIAAGWDISAYRLHDLARGGDPKALATQVANAVAGRVKKDLSDGSSFVSSSGSQWLSPLASGTLTQVTCAPRSGNEAGPDSGPGAATPAISTNRLQTGGWVGCSAQVQYKNRLVPQKLFQEFHAGMPDLLPASIATMNICGMGNTLQGCQGAKAPGFVLLTDDYGVENSAKIEVGESGGSNEEYFNTSRDVYQGDSVTKAAILAAEAGVMTAVGVLIEGPDKADCDKFKMGYAATIDTTTKVPSDGPDLELHLSPYHEDPSSANSNTRDLSKQVYEDGKRVSNNYLGKPNPNFNSP